MFWYWSIDRLDFIWSPYIPKKKKIYKKQSKKGIKANFSLLSSMWKRYYKKPSLRAKLYWKFFTN